MSTHSSPVSPQWSPPLSPTQNHTLDPWLSPTSVSVSDSRQHYHSASSSASISDRLLKNVPDEIWCLILTFIPPARLLLLTRVCRRWKHMIEQDLASFWKQLAVQCKIQLENNNSTGLEGTAGGVQSLDSTGFYKTQRLSETKTTSATTAAATATRIRELVLGHTLLICEICLTRSRNGVGSAVPLPVTREDAIGRVWMCRPCRRKHYDRYPEQRRCTQPMDYTDQNGATGLNMWSLCSAPVVSPKSPTATATTAVESVSLATKSNTGSSLQQQQQRSTPSLAIEPLNSPFMEHEHADEIAGQGVVVEARRHHGGYIGIRAHFHQYDINSILRPRRRKLISTLLSQQGLRLRADSKLCGRYLMGSKDDPFKVAMVMKEMEWYYKETDYASFMDEDYGTMPSKAAAIREWLEETVELHGLQMAKDAYKRPFLKPPIKLTLLSPGIVMEGSVMLESSQATSEKAATTAEKDVEDVTMVDKPDWEVRGVPPRSLWSLLDDWLDHWIKGDMDYRPPFSKFSVRCEDHDQED